MAYKDGSKSGGRKKGTLNKSSELRELLLTFTNETKQDAFAAFRRISDPDKKFALWLKAVEFNVAKLSSIELKEEKPRKTYQDELDELEEEYK